MLSYIVRLSMNDTGVYKLFHSWLTTSQDGCNGIEETEFYYRWICVLGNICLTLAVKTVVSNLKAPFKRKQTMPLPETGWKA